MFNILVYCEADDLLVLICSALYHALMYRIYVFFFIERLVIELLSTES